LKKANHLGESGQRVPAAALPSRGHGLERCRSRGEQDCVLRAELAGNRQGECSMKCITAARGVKGLHLEGRKVTDGGIGG